VIARPEDVAFRTLVPQSGLKCLSHTSPVYLGGKQGCDLRTLLKGLCDDRLLLSAFCFLLSYTITQLPQESVWFKQQGHYDRFTVSLSWVFNTPFADTD
jgi:hypothetical protein